MAGSGGYLNGTLAWSPDGTRLADAGRRGTSVWSLTHRSAPVFAVERDRHYGRPCPGADRRGWLHTAPVRDPAARSYASSAPNPPRGSNDCRGSPSRTIEPQMEDAGTAARQA
jgi:hypothetical protein